MQLRWVGGVRRIVSGLGAFLLADLITGMAAFSVITLSSLWFFSIGWLALSQEYASQGLGFGSAGASELAWVGVLVALPLVAPTIFLAARAYRLPLGLYRASVPNGFPLRGLARAMLGPIRSRIRGVRRPSHRSGQ